MILSLCKGGAVGITIKKLEAGGITYVDRARERRYAARWGAYRDGKLLAIIYKSGSDWSVVGPAPTFEHLAKTYLPSAKAAKTWAVENL